MITTLRQRTAPATHIDHVAWPVDFTLDAYGMFVRLRASDRMLHPILRRVVPPGVLRADLPVIDTTYSLVATRGLGEHHERLRLSHDTTFGIYETDRLAGMWPHLDEMITWFESRLHFDIAVHARTRLFVHAGVIGWEGGAILFPGRSFAGKSTLVAELVRAGATYYSDEYAVLDDSGAVHPFARALGIRDASGTTHRVDPARLGAVGNAPLPVRAIFVTRHRHDAAWEPRRMSPGETVLALVENTLAVRSRPADSLRILSAAVRGAIGFRTARGDAASVVEQILNTTLVSAH